MNEFSDEDSPDSPDSPDFETYTFLNKIIARVSYFLKNGEFPLILSPYLYTYHHLPFRGSPQFTIGLILVTVWGDG